MCAVEDSIVYAFRSFLLVVPLVGWCPIHAGESPKTALEAAESRYFDHLAKLAADLRGRLERKADAARAAGNKKLLDEATAELTELDKYGDLNLSVLTPEYRNRMLAQRQQLESAYKVAIRDFTRAKQDDLAQSTEKQLQKFEDDPKFAFLDATKLSLKLARLRPSNAELLFDADDGNRGKNGCKLQLWGKGPKGQSGTKDLRIEPLEDGYCKIVLKSTGLVVQAATDAPNARGFPAELWEWNGSRHQQWMFVKVGKHFRILNRATGRVLEADPDRLRENGCQVQLGTYRREAHQLWTILD